jgi:hypothetical protein
MFEYEAIDRFNSRIPAESIVELNQDQARRRNHCIKEVSKGTYRALTSLSFKIGERIKVKDELEERQYGKLFQSMSAAKVEVPVVTAKPKEKSAPKPKKKKGFL